MIRTYRGHGVDNFWQEMEAFQKQIESIFSGKNRGAGDAYPPVNIYQNEDALMVYSMVPGLHAEDVDLTITDDLLTISGKVERNSTPANQEIETIRNERSSGQFQRTIRLPYTISSDRVEATVKNGILKLVLPRAEEDKPRKISVKAS